MKPMQSKPAIGGKPSLYANGSPQRKLLVVVDADTVTGPGDVADAHGLLQGLLSHDQIDVLRYSSEDVPGDASMLETDWFPPAAIGWLVAKQVKEADRLVSHTLTHCDGETVTSGALFSGLVDRFSERLAAIASAPAGKSEEQAALMLLAAGEIGADLLITNRSNLRIADTLNLPAPVSVASTPEAIPMIGLYLRSQGEYILSRVGNGSIVSDKRSFWERSAFMFVPSLRAVLAGSSQLDQERASAVFAPLARAALRRAVRAMERRDAIWLLVNQQQDFDGAEDAIAAFESLLLFVMGSLDATARLVDGILELDSKGPNIGWQKNGWLKMAQAKSDQISRLFFRGSREWAALEVLRTLRNFIHAEGLEAIFIEANGKIRATGIVIPRNGGGILDTIDEAGDRDSWGVRTVEGIHFAELGPLTDNLMLEVLYAIESACEAIADLLQLQVPNAVAQPRDGLMNEALVSLHQQWQLGLGEPDGDAVELCGGL